MLVFPSPLMKDNMHQQVYITFDSRKIFLIFMCINVIILDFLYILRLLY